MGFEHVLLAYIGLLVSSKVQNEIRVVALDRNDTVLSHLVLRETSAAHVLTTKTFGGSR